MTREKEIAILMADKCTRKEAEKHLKKGTIVFESVKDWYESMDESIQKVMEEDHDTDREGLLDLAASGMLVDTAVVNYDGNTYFIEYSL